MAHDGSTHDRLGDWDAIVLAGGRSSRLDGRDKTALVYRDRSLLDHALTSVLGARTIAVVGPPELESRLGYTGSHAHVVLATEVPRFGGPACAVARGLETLSSDRSEWTVVVAADQPAAVDAVAALLAERRRHPQSDALVARDDTGRLQPLLAIYRTAPLAYAVATSGSIDGLSMMALCSRLAVVPVALGGLCLDVDTPQDAAHYGIDLPIGLATSA